MLENIKESDFEDLWKWKRHLYYNEIPDTWYIDWNWKLSDKDLSKINWKLKELWIDFRWDNNVSTEVNYIKLWLSVGWWSRWASDFLNSLWFNWIEVKNADWHVHVVFDRDKIWIKRVENF
jgi:hypothetical protein